LGDIVGIGAKLAAAKQHVAGIDLVHDMAGLVGNLDGAAVQGAAMQQPFTQHLATAVNRFPPGGLGVGEFLALRISVEDAAFADMEEIAGHDLDAVVYSYF
jgi:hypothetical protein